MDQGYEGASDEGVTALPMIPAPQHLTRGMHDTRTTIPWGAAQVVSAGQTSAHPRMKVTPHLEVKTMPPM